MTSKSLCNFDGDARRKSRIAGLIQASDGNFYGTRESRRTPSEAGSLFQNDSRR